MRVRRILGFVLLGVGGIAALLVFVALWHLYVPSASAMRLSQLYAQRTRAPDADNAYIYLWGFSAPPGTDALEMGRRRMAWLQQRLADPDGFSPDPLGEELDLEDMRSGRMKTLARVCGASPTEACVAEFDAWPAEQAFSEREKASLERYRVMIAYRRWFESAPIPASDGPLPPFGLAFDGQRVLMLELRQAAAAGDTTRVRDTLQRDLAFWREVLKSSDLLISKMLACASIRNNFLLGNFVLRRMPPAQQAEAIPPLWRQPFSVEEVSILRATAGEFIAWREQMNEWRDAGAGFDDLDEEYEEDPVDDWLSSIGHRVRPWQRELNRLADAYLELAVDFEVPLDQFAVTKARYEERYADSPIGKGLTGYPLRVGGVEGMRRAVLLVAELRSRGVTEATMSAELAASELRNPFTLEPLEWDARQHAVVYEGLDNHRSRRQAYLY